MSHKVAISAQEVATTSPKFLAGGDMSASAVNLALLQEWLRGLQENVLDELDPNSMWYSPAKEWVQEKVAAAWTRYLAEAAWMNNKLLRATRPSRLSLRTSQTY